MPGPEGRGTAAAREDPVRGDRHDTTDWIPRRHATCATTWCSSTGRVASPSSSARMCSTSWNACAPTTASSPTAGWYGQMTAEQVQHECGESLRVRTADPSRTLALLEDASLGDGVRFAAEPDGSIVVSGGSIRPRLRAAAPDRPGGAGAVDAVAGHGGVFRRADGRGTVMLTFLRCGVYRLVHGRKFWIGTALASVLCFAVMALMFVTMGMVDVDGTVSTGNSPSHGGRRTVRGCRDGCGRRRPARHVRRPDGAQPLVPAGVHGVLQGGMAGLLVSIIATLAYAEDHEHGFVKAGTAPAGGRPRTVRASTGGWPD